MNGGATCALGRESGGCGDKGRSGGGAQLVGQDREGKAVEVLRGGRVTFKTRPGETVLLAPAD